MSASSEARNKNRAAAAARIAELSKLLTEALIYIDTVRALLYGIKPHMPNRGEADLLAENVHNAIKEQA